MSLPGCDAAEQGRDDSFRVYDGEGECEGEPQPAVIDATRGGPVIKCPECGSHWTIAGGSNGGIDGGVVAVYLDPELGRSLLSLAEKGTLRYRDKRGEFTWTHRGPAKGYTLEVRPFSSSHKGDRPATEGCDQKDAVLSIVHDANRIEVCLSYVNNHNGEFEDPPIF